MKIKNNTKFSFIFWLLMWVILVVLIFIIFVITVEARDFTIASPFISFRDPRTGEIMDYLLGLTLWNWKNKQIFSLEFERLNGFPYREIVFRAEAYGWYVKLFEKTSRAIDNVFVGYFRQAGIFRAGGSIHKDISGTVSLLADVGIRSKYFTAKFQRGLKTWIVDGEFKWSKPISKELFTIRGFKFVPAFQVLVKYYQDGYGRIYRQAKVSLTIGA